jgi:hypothetical protein
MDHRIGILIREGKTIYYAHINGEFPERDSADEIAALLDGKVLPPVQPKTASTKETLRSYLVTVSMKHPAWDDKPFDLQIEATSQKTAISLARKQIARECRFTRQDGAILYKANRKC